MLPLSEYCIGVIGVKNADTPQGGRKMFHDEVEYDVLIYDENAFRRLSTDVRRSPEFNLKPVTDSDENNSYMGLFFQPWLSEQFGNVSKYRIISTFFDLSQYLAVPEEMPQLCNRQDESIPTEPPLNSIPAVSELYSMLREAHERTDTNVSQCDVNIPPQFAPQLRSYQLKALQWMLSREKVTQYSNVSEFVPIKCHSCPTQRFYFNFRTTQLTDYEPRSLKIPSGGILADEMGLGKTVEMLALLLCNPRLKRKGNEKEDGIPSVLCKVLSSKRRLKCVCSNTSRKKNVIQCPRCLFYQHEKCVTSCSENPIMDYICPECWKLEEPIECSTTFIVSPPSIKMQWNEEIEKHIFDTNFKVFIYNGIKQSGWISPRDLATYDVVLTDYNIMKSEIYYSSTKRRESGTRSEPRYIIPTSPLTMIRWWRTVLDEAQIVEVAKNNCSRMVKSLPATHRWAVTGTPIEKSIDNLHGLIYFLDYEPFSDLKSWKNLMVPYYKGDAQPLIEQCLKNVMWRTCKVNVWMEIGLPPQQEITHNITMSDLQACFYYDEHSQCSTAFFDKAKKLGKSLSMFKMDPKTLKLILEPLKKLRQDCSVPTIFQKTKKQDSVKKLLTPSELHKHMVKENETNCKERLRLIASCLNGMAALHIIRHETETAVEMYLNVLRLAKDHTGTICVDSLLQVHALHNLLDIARDKYSEQTVAEYSQELERLEIKYLENRRTLVETCKKQQLKIETDITELKQNAHDLTLTWWADYLNENIYATKLQQVIIDRVSNELQNYQNQPIESINSFHGILYVLFTWLEKVDKQRKAIQKWFVKLSFFSTNIKPRNALSVKQAKEIDLLVQSAFDCHLDLEKPKKSENQTPPRCLLCKVKDALLKYESLIFDKTYVDDINRVNSGNWNPCYQEMILKVIYSNVKRECNDEHVVDDGKLHLQIIDLIKDEYKEYSKYWVEVDYAAAAYDELKMCKSRMEVYDPEIEDEHIKSKLKVSKYEVYDTLFELKDEKEAAERGFLKIKGVLKYLEHLKSTTEPDMCPICKEVPQAKYCVFQCGHHVCYICYAQIGKIHKTTYKCCICRSNQKINEIHIVTCKPKQTDSGSISVIGDYSDKIEEIVLTALKLRTDDPNVKIIIFSHWENILNVIAAALAENGIQHRSKSSKFYKCIEDFKNSTLNVTCLLLPLAYGSKGLNLIEATHVFLVEPILNPGDEFQAISRVHRIGQTKPTFVHRFIVLKTIEETIYNTVSSDTTGKWYTKEVTIENLNELFTLNR